MIPAELERLIMKSIADGKIPFFVTATAGTTVFGAFDPIHPIADICEKHHLWLHIDVFCIYSIVVPLFSIDFYCRLLGVEVCSCRRNSATNSTASRGEATRNNSFARSRI